jgi:MinD-like ATPase involved in chromosome partitioning or flagellar assembly
VIIALHSYKGGTGKTLLSVNLATLFAKMGKKVCLLDLDLRAPSIHSSFKNGTEYWVNDYLSKACKIEKVLSDCTSQDMAKGKLFVGLANPSIEAIREMESKDGKWRRWGGSLRLGPRSLTICTSITCSLIPAQVFNIPL